MTVFEYVITAIVGLWLSSMEYRMKRVNEKVDDKLSKHDVLELIDLKQEAIKASQLDIKEDTVEIKKKLDKIQDHLMNLKS